MLRVSLRSGAATLALAALVAAGMTAAPLSLSDDLSLESKVAQAKNGNDKGGRGGGNDKGGRGGNDKGNGGGIVGCNGGGNGNAGGKSASASTSETALDASDVELDEEEDTAKKKGMGSLSASNSSQRARERAAPNSRPGALGAYERALAEGDVEAAAEALARAANKEITPENVGMVNENLGIQSSPEEEAEMAALAEAARTAAPDEDGEVEGEENVAEGEDGGDEGDPEEGPDEIAAAVEDLMGDTTTQ